MIYHRATTAIYIFYVIVSVASNRSEKDERILEIDPYVGTFSNKIGTDLWIWVAAVAGGTFLTCVVIYCVCVFCEFLCKACSCCCRDSKKKSDIDMSDTRQ